MPRGRVTICGHKNESKEEAEAFVSSWNLDLLQIVRSFIEEKPVFGWSSSVEFQLQSAK